jgi:hypothetical protein
VMLRQHGSGASLKTLHNFLEEVAPVTP